MAAKKKKAKASRRKPAAKDKTQISISLNEDLVARIDALAAKENRNRSNYIVTVLEALDG